MFDLFLALFGGLYWGNKYAQDRRAGRQREQKRKAYNEIQNQIVAPVNYPRPKNSDEFWIMAEEISDDLKFIFGQNWRSRLNYVLLSPYDYIRLCGNTVSGTFRHNIGIAYEVWLSSKGYISFLRNKYCFAFIGEQPPLYDDKNSEDNSQIALRAFERIEKNLQKSHPDLSLKLYTVPDRKYDLKWGHEFALTNCAVGERLWSD